MNLAVFCAAWLCGGCYESHRRGTGADDADVGIDAAPTDAGPACAAAASVAEIEAFLDEWARAECEGLLSCATGPTWPSIDECVLSYAEVRATAPGDFAIPRAALVTAAARGALTLDRAAAAACLLAWRNYCPERFFALGPAPGCETAVRARCATPEGTPCASLFDCGPGAYCDTALFPGPDGAGLACGAGACRPVERLAGRPCDADAPCPGWCYSGTCREYGGVIRDAALGDECDAAILGPDGRVWQRECVPDLYCLASACARPLLPGAACAASERCIAGYQCVDGRCERGGSAPGERCGGSPVAFCASSDLVCVDAVCVVADGSRGAACDGAHPCGPSLACRGGGRCGDLASPGESCGRNRDCLSGECAGAACCEPR